MEGFTLARVIPTRIKSVKFLWCKRDFQRMGPEWRKTRARLKPMNSCFWCKREFEDGEMMALACPEKGMNRLLCHACVDSAQLPDKGE